MKVKSDHGNKFSNLSNWKEEAWKQIRVSTRFEPVYGGLSLSLEICQRFYEKTFQLNRFFNKNVKQKIINT